MLWCQSCERDEGLASLLFLFSGTGCFLSPFCSILWHLFSSCGVEQYIWKRMNLIVETRTWITDCCWKWCDKDFYFLSWGKVVFDSSFLNIKKSTFIIFSECLLGIWQGNNDKHLLGLSKSHLVITSNSFETLYHFLLFKWGGGHW